MKKIKWSKTFSKNYKKRIKGRKGLEQELTDAVEIFLLQHPQSKTHALRGSMKSLKAFSINEDYRVIYKETKEYFLFLDIGTHRQVYRP